MKRILFFAYGIVVYVIFLGTFLYAVGFIGDFGVPTALDGPARGSLGAALALDLALLAIFAVQHSLMARRWFKQRWTQIVPPPIERSTYVLFSSVALSLLLWQWRPMGGVIWSVEDPTGRVVLRGLFAFGWGLVLLATFLINHFDLFGLRQVWLHLLGRPYTPLRFATPGPYRIVRHPLYVGWLFAFWMTPTMTLAHLVFAIATTGYILIAIQFEERDLVHHLGSAYEEYRRKVPMLVPFAPRRRGALPRKRATMAARIWSRTLLVALFFLLNVNLAVAKKQVTICHHPPGNPTNMHTISVGESAIPAHLKHGDELGDCPTGCQLNPAICDDGDACTSDVCRSNGGCDHTPVNCDDGNPCTTEVCVNGSCTTTPADGGVCDDQNVCSRDDLCSGGACRGTAIPGCCIVDADCADDGDRCTIERCIAGACSREAKDCSIPDDKCAAGVCHPDTGQCDIAQVDCNDSNFCTDDFCDASTGCFWRPTSNPPEPSETSCTDGLDNDCDGLIDSADPDCLPPDPGPD